MNASRDQHGEHRVTPGDRTLDDVTIIRGSRNNGDSPLELVELCHALLAAHANHLVVSIQRVLDHVLSEFSRRPDDANLHACCSFRLTDTNGMPKSRILLSNPWSAA
jgi:hypothetical protein